MPKLIGHLTETGYGHLDAKVDSCLLKHDDLKATQFVCCLLWYVLLYCIIFCIDISIVYDVFIPMPHRHVCQQFNIDYHRKEEHNAV